MKRFAILLLMSIATISCNKDTGADCMKVCTQIFMSVMIKFVDKNGAPTEVKGYKVVNLRTGEELKASANTIINPVPGVFAVVDDGSIKKLSVEGDNLEITGTSVATNQTKSAVIKVTGGECECHIDKISGPEQIMFD